MNELNIYKLFQNIFDKSSILEGRFSIATGYGSSLDDEKVGDYITSRLQPKRYPLVALFPPVDFPRVKKTDYKMKMVFVVQQGEGTTGIKDSLGNNTSGHPIIYDWKDMRECALNFISVLLKSSKIPPRFFDVKVDMIERFSYVGTQNLSGVTISFDMTVLDDWVCDVLSGTEYSISDNELRCLFDKSDIHPQHKH